MACDWLFPTRYIGNTPQYIILRPVFGQNCQKFMFGVTFDPKTQIFNIFSDFASDGPISRYHLDPIQKPKRVKIGSKIMSTTIQYLRQFCPIATSF